MYEKLNLKNWPFNVVPNPEFAKVWAGRHLIKKQLDRLILRMQLSPKSSLRLMWANFGMGKTHTLMHIQYLCDQIGNKLVPVYTVMPNKPRGFIDIYRAIVSVFPFEFLGDQLVKVGNESAGIVTLHPMFSRSPGVVAALLAIRSGDLERSIAAQQWLIAQPGLSARNLRQVGVTYRIKTPEDAINALNVLTKLATFGISPSAKLVVLLDEYQRIGELKPSVRNEINAGLHAYFNSNPTGVEIMLSFSFGRQDNVIYLLSNELKSRAEPQSISLDVLKPKEGVEFVADLLTQFRVENDGRWAYPFSPEAINSLIKHISLKKTLTPRRIMLYANHALTEHLINLPDSTVEISSAEILDYLDDPQLGALDVDSQNEI